MIHSFDFFIMRKFWTWCERPLVITNSPQYRSRWGEASWLSLSVFFDTYGLIMAAAFHLTGRSFTESAMCILSRFPLSVSWKTLVGENLRYCQVVGKFAPFTLALLSVYCRMTFDNDKDILHYRVWLVKYIFHSCTFGDLKIFQMLLYPFGNLANID